MGHCKDKTDPSRIDDAIMSTAAPVESAMC
jgi:hypothetical protein